MYYFAEAVFYMVCCLSFWLCIKGYKATKNWGFIFILLFFTLSLVGHIVNFLTFSPSISGTGVTIGRAVYYPLFESIIAIALYKFTEKYL